MKKTFTFFILVFILNGIHAQTVDLKIWDLNKLNLIKVKIGQVETPYYNAYNKLKEEVDDSWAKEPVSVMQKEYTAPSGDKHDYVSMGPYWWPNPNTPDGLPYIRKDGERNPELNKLDRNAIGQMIETVINLSLVYYFSGDEKYAQKAIKQINVWFLDNDTKMNPNLNYGQFIPGYNDNKGRGAGIIDIYSFTVLLDAIELLKISPSFSQGNKTVLDQWFTEFLLWMTTSEIGLSEKTATNNHGLAYDVLVARIASFTGNTSIFEQILSDFPNSRLFKQIQPDGKQPRELERTMAMHYSLFNISHMLDMCHMAGKKGKDIYFASSDDGRCITVAINFVAQYLGKSQNEFPYQQIKNWDQLQKQLCLLLKRASEYDSTQKYIELFNKYHTSGNETLVNLIEYE